MTRNHKSAGEPLPVAEPPHYEKADIYAIKALFDGVATDGQQKRALNWILTGACGMDRDPFRADSRLSEHLVGRQSVGRAILELKNARARD